MSRKKKKPEKKHKKWIGKGHWHPCTTDGIHGFEWRYIEKIEVEEKKE